MPDSDKETILFVIEGKEIIVPESGCLLVVKRGKRPDKYYTVRITKNGIQVV